METNLLEFLKPDPFLEDVRSDTLAAGKFNIKDVQRKYGVGYSRAVKLRDALVAEGILDKVETDGQNWLSGSLVLQDKAEELDTAMGRIVSMVGSGGSKEFYKLVKVMAVEPSAVMRMVIMAGIRVLLSTLGER